MRMGVTTYMASCGDFYGIQRFQSQVVALLKRIWWLIITFPITMPILWSYPMFRENPTIIFGYASHDKYLICPQHSPHRPMTYPHLNIINLVLLMVKSRLLMVYPMVPCRIHCVPINSLVAGNYPYYRVAPNTPNTRGCWGDFCRLSHEFFAEIPWRSGRKIPWSHHFHWVTLW